MASTAAEQDRSTTEPPARKLGQRGLQTEALAETRSSERYELLKRLGQEAGQVLEQLGDRVDEAAPAWQFLASSGALPEESTTAESGVGFVQSLRAAEAVVDLVEVFERWATDGLQSKADEAVAAGQGIEVKELLGNVQDELDGNGNRAVPYSIANLVCYRARCEFARDRDGKPPQELPHELIDALSEQIKLVLDLDAASQGGFHVHPFTLHHLMRALVHAEYCGQQLADDKKRLAKLVLDLSERLIARTVLRSGSEAECVALVFCAAALSLSNPEDGRSHIEAALNAAVSSQQSSGCWIEGCVAGRMRDPDTGNPLEISTYDVALAVADTALGLTRSDKAGARPIPQAAIEALWRAIGHADVSRRQLDGAQSPAFGWSCSQVYGEPRVEALATASILSLTVRFRQLLDDVARHEVLPTYEVDDPAEEFWPDWLKWSKYKERSEPDSKNRILTYLDREVVQATKRRDERHPYPWARTEQITVLLFGPPGTTKTTIVRAVAEGLRWPLITLGPGDFIRDGLEKVEQRADAIFSDLHALSRTVVLFDECDELFRSRDVEVVPDQGRGIAAFVTASMLPKLQDLHDRGQIVLFILTNYFANMDPAIKRLGRIDHMIGVGPPDDPQRQKILDETFSRELKKTGQAKGVPDNVTRAAVCHLAPATDHYVRGELVRLATKVAGSLLEEENPTEARARALAKDQLERQPDPTITPQIFEDFEGQQRDSLPHLEAPKSDVEQSNDNTAKTDDKQSDE